jgi:hypothetical protein
MIAFVPDGRSICGKSPIPIARWRKVAHRPPCLKDRTPASMKKHRTASAGWVSRFGSTQSGRLGATLYIHVKLVRKRPRLGRRSCTSEQFPIVDVAYP